MSRPPIRPQSPPPQVGDQTIDRALGALHRRASVLEGLRNDAAGTYLGRQVITRTGTYTPTKGARSVLVRLVGGGGGGGGDVTTGFTYTAGSGGNSGTCLEAYVSTSGLVPGPVSIGSGGPGGDASRGGVGNSGNDTSIVINGSRYLARGGAGGSAASSPGAEPSVNPDGSGPSGLPTYAPGGPGVSNGSNTASPGTGGSSPFGTGGLGGSQGGAPGQGYGSGGGGTCTFGSATEVHTGGPGAPGVVVLDEFA